MRHSLTSNRATIRKFVVAGQFIEILRCFENGMTEEVGYTRDRIGLFSHTIHVAFSDQVQMEQKLQYARWKAADGAKALREGRTPSSGPREWATVICRPITDTRPAIPEETEDPFPSIPSEPPSTSSSSPPKDGRGSFSSSTRPTIPPQPSPNGSGSASMPSPRPSPAHVPQRTNLPSIDTTPRPEARTPKRTHSSTSVAWSTVATPGLADDDDDRQFNLPPSKVQPSAPTEYDLTPTGSRSSGEKKNVRFMGPDGAPLSPAQTVLTVDSYDTPDAPPPSTFSPAADSPKRAPMGVPIATDSATANGRPRGDSSSSMTRPSVPQAGGQPSTLRPQGNGRSRGDSISRNTNPVPPPPPPSLASYPSQPPSQPNSNGLGLSSPPPSAPPAVPTRKQVEQTQKHARWAVSALDFDDYETARAELRRALAVLGG